MIDEDQVREVIKQLQNMQATLDNLKATQDRCSKLIEENRKLERENRALRDMLDRVACAAVENIAESAGYPIDPFEGPTS